MEKIITKRKRVSLINELIQGKELAKQLSNHIVLSSNETNEFLIDKIISTYQKTLTMLNCWPNVEEGQNNKTIDGNGHMRDSHSSFTNESPKSEDVIIKHKAIFNKRKSMPTWKEQVMICTNTGLFEGSLDDEYSWRKYGQKDILGAKFSRGYYRCTHRTGQGCLATKQVQRSDEDPTIIEVTYKGRHTCSQSNKPLKKITDLNENKLHNEKKNNQLQQTQEASFTLQAELDVKRMELEETKEDIFPWFCFPSPSSIESENETMMESFSHAFISQETSEANFFGLSEYQLGCIGLCQNVQTSESDITESVSVTTSVANSPILDLDILLHRGDFDTEFPFNNPEYFSS